MANPSISVPDELLDDFDRINQMKDLFGEEDTGGRSAVIQELMREYVEENEEYLERYKELAEGNPNPAMVTV